MKTDSGIMNISGKNTNLKHKRHFEGENTMENIEKILNKIKNLLDLANNNPNKNEAMAAAV